MHEEEERGPAGGEATRERSGPAEVEALEERLRDLAADSDAPPGERALGLSAFEHDLLALSARRLAADPSFGTRRGLPAVAWAADWRDQVVEHGLDGETGAERLVEALVEDDAWGWCEHAADAGASGSAAACFEVLAEAGALDREAVARRRHGATQEPPLRHQREPLRAAFLAALADRPPEPEVLSAWATELADAADVELSGADDVDGVRAARQLELMADDVAWHLRHVPAPGKAGRRLRRKLRRLRRERQERELQGGLERSYGRGFVRVFDRVVMWLIFLVLAILLVEVLFTHERPDGGLETDLPFGVHLTLAVLDTLACLVFLLEFFVKLARVRGRTSWFLRHALIDLLPSLPVGLFLVSMHALRGESLAGAQLLRVWRLGRALRLARYARGVGFIARGFDRLGRRYGHLLNHDIVLFPNRQERQAAEREAESVAPRIWRLRSRVGDAWRDLLQSAPPERRWRVARTRVQALEDARAHGLLRRPPWTPGQETHSVREIPAERMLRRLDAVTPAELEADLGVDFVARLARAVRSFSRPGVRWLPVIRRYVPRVGPRTSAGEVTAAASHRVAGELGRYYDRWLWFADLNGTITPAEFVDRVGTTMVRSSFRPAYRLALFGLAYLFVDGFISLFEARQLEWLRHILENYLGPVIYVLGTVCVGVLGLGWWLKHLAGQATFFYDQTVNAQFLALTEAIKGRHIDHDAALLDARVFAPEEATLGVVTPGGAATRRRDFAAAVRSWLVQARSGRDLGGLGAAMERTILLYRDGQDGALFNESDNRTTSQLLGNPALLQMRGLSRRLGRREDAALAALDLSRPRSSFRGPYLWFTLISKAMAQSTARLIVEYNRFAIPLDELPRATERERLRYESWIETGGPPASEGGREKLHLQRRGYITTAFTALHFLDDDVGRDRDIADRFGLRVLENLRRDRRALFREAFGTYPLHARPKDQRVLNLYRVYDRWFGGGRAFFIPVRVTWRWLGMAARLTRWLLRAVGEVRTPRARADPRTTEQYDFHTALRKIGRMRNPVLWAASWIRARLDAEYLGVRIPGAPDVGMAGAPWEEDLRFMRASGSQRRLVEREKARAEADVRRLARLMEDEGLRARVAAEIGVEPAGLTREHVRAATLAYRADFAGVRSLLSCTRILDETRAASLDRPPLPGSRLPRVRLRLAYRRWWGAHGRGGSRVRRATWRAVLRDVGGSRGALRAWGRLGAEVAFERGVRLLGRMLRHPGRLTEQLVTLRAVHTLALIDLRLYREHVFRLGEYADSGDDAEGLLDLRPGPASQAPTRPR